MSDKGTYYKKFRKHKNSRLLFIMGACLICFGTCVMLWVYIFQFTNPELTQTQVFFETWAQISISSLSIIIGCVLTNDR